MYVDLRRSEECRVGRCAAGVMNSYNDYDGIPVSGSEHFLIDGIDERERGNNHGTCWVMQVAAFARMLGDQATLAYCRTRFKTWLLPNRMFQDGSFPLEVRRTKPYGYALFQFDQIATVAQILSTPDDNLRTCALPDGRTRAWTPAGGVPPSTPSHTAVRSSRTRGNQPPPAPPFRRPSMRSGGRCASRQRCACRRECAALTPA